MQLVRQGPTQLARWPADMRRVRVSAFALPLLSLRERLSRRRRYFADGERYPPQLTQHPCWIVRAELDAQLVGYVWAYERSGDGSWVYIEDVAVHADHQSRGIGTALIADMRAWMSSVGVEHLTGLPTNRPMTRIFQRFEIPATPPPSAYG